MKKTLIFKNQLYWLSGLLQLWRIHFTGRPTGLNRRKGDFWSLEIQHFFSRLFLSCFNTLKKNLYQKSLNCKKGYKSLSPARGHPGLNPLSSLGVKPNFTIVPSKKNMGAYWSKNIFQVIVNSKSIWYCGMIKKMLFIDSILFQTHWHARPECFQCNVCHSSLIGKKLAKKFGLILCSSDCAKKAAETLPKPNTSSPNTSFLSTDF